MAVKKVSGFTKELADLVEDRIAMIQDYLNEGKAACRSKLARFVWSTAKKVRNVVNPERDVQHKKAWEEAKGMLKELVDFELFNPCQLNELCVKYVLEPKVVKVLVNYHHFVLTRQIKTRHTSPKLLGQTDEILCIDKPPMFTCSYGGFSRLPHRAKVSTPTQLLNCEKATIQIHEYLALTYDYETASGTREFWKQEDEESWRVWACGCGECDSCACMQSGCCNRLDKETSGIVVAAKTRRGFPVIRKQFSTAHSLEAGGTEKFYFALARGQVKIPTTTQERSPDWIHGPDGPPSNRRGRIQIAIRFDQSKWKAFPYNDGGMTPGQDGNERSRKATATGGGDWDEDGEQGEPANVRLFALTFYDPIAWFSNDANEKYTLLRVQIISGRTHQIRFHCSEIGHPLVADDLYGASQSERDWAKRVFLHSYQTKFLEPFSDKWYEAVSPLPEDLGQLLAGLQLDRVKERCPLFLSRRKHSQLHRIFKPYDPDQELLQVHAAPWNAREILQEKMKTLSGRNTPSWGNSTAQRQPNEPDKFSQNLQRWKWEDQCWGADLSWRATSMDEDESWGTWESKGAEPEPKRPRLEIPAAEPANAGQVPCTPPYPDAKAW
ncbi:Uncharacterized RNA pseudouridine synthase Caur_0901 (RNA pseudouridylate synthase) (RNA-uridine isomerase) [Durusdinium trenchii]|uniref:Uncharacterized RNA pseudouridine synthase Caur_0901 (RNA pseudouridylate synthase) (RNA-uridine isomerase) n=1 Tax=Durusdinium trenchii TaxID=1381693 RepID=A0ABP0PCY8_9DINO